MSSYSALYVHIVFATSHRAPTIQEAWMLPLHAYIAGTIRGLGAEAIEVGGVADHVHLLVGLRTTHAVAPLVREIKKASTAWVRERWHAFSWQTGYGALSVSPRDLSMLKAYIQNQEEHHRTVCSDDELRALLAECGIEVDERYFE